MPLNICQKQTPIFDAVKKYIDDAVIPFHVPGHKQGAGLPELSDYVGCRVLQMDLNGMDDLDYANNPTGVIAQAEQLMAQAYGAAHAFFLVGGTTSGVQAMIMTACKPGDKIILPRNAHKSTIGGIILSGAIPVYIRPEISTRLGVAMGVTPGAVAAAIRENPDAAAVFLINPTYYGAASDLAAIIALAHGAGMSVLVDEAHGAHMKFHEDFPVTAMEAGADMSAASLHKTAGSLTQSSALLTGAATDPEKVRAILNLTYTSSASYLLLSSLDLARKQLATRGGPLLARTLALARYARREINKIDGLYAFGTELAGTPGVFAFDETKLGIHVTGLGLTGYRMEKLLREGYGIQAEMSDLYNILMLVTLGDDQPALEALVSALRDIAQKSVRTQEMRSTAVPVDPTLVVSPREAFYRPKKAVRLEASAGLTAGEMVMAYPPGIPVIGLGERITPEIIEYIGVLKREKCALQGTADKKADWIRVLA